MYTYEKKETILKVEGVSLKLGDNQILKDIKIEVKDIVRPDMTQGQIIGFLGPSGIGKTKFFEMLSGIIPINGKNATGQVLIGQKLEPVKIGNVGVIQQNYPLFEHRTIYGNLDISAKIKYKNKKEREDRINDILQRLGLITKKKSYPAELSGGQRQRAAIAQQILCSNNFLLMDEPFSGLDPVAIEEVSKLIVEVANLSELNTIIIVSHDILSTTAIADTLWIMGRDREMVKDKDGVEKEVIIPGAKIKYEYDLIEKGIAWRPDNKSTHEFHVLCDELRNLFPKL
jgi:polar amino acid transport system ATP-binding protein/sulfate transport system ATP-binding protein